MTFPLTPRDLEVLRTLLRTQVASTLALQSAFFTQLRLARRRLGLLRDRGLIAIHDRGLPGPIARAGSTYWRLSRQGLAVVAEAFADERIPDSASDRAAAASLRNFEHRDATTELYLSLIADRHKEASELRRRAGQITWRGEYETVLRYQAVEGAAFVERQIVPDATVTGVRCSARFFLELDRATESRSRCSRAIEAYAAYVRQGGYARDFADALVPTVVYVTRNTRRHEGLCQVAATARAAEIAVEVFSFAAAVRHLGAALHGDDAGSAVVDTGADDPADGSGCEACGTQRAAAQGALGALARVYDAYRSDLAARRAAGQAVESPACLREAYALLQARAPAAATTTTRSPERPDAG